MTDPTEAVLAKQQAERDLAALNEADVDSLAVRRRAALDASFAAKSSQLAAVRKSTDINGNPRPPAAG